MNAIDRRSIVGAAPIIFLAGAAPAAETTMSQTISYEAKALSFDPSGIAGLSEKLLTSHHQNNYAGAVRKLGAIETELAGTPASDIPGYRLSGLKREELIAHNSIVLHEIYFDGLAGDEAPSKALGKAIASSFGSMDAWRNEFAAMGKALAGGSGWVLLTWSQRAGRLINAWSADHTMVAAGGTVIAALDMYEHAYAIDYGANAGAYVDAYIAALKWTNASRIFGSLR